MKKINRLKELEKIADQLGIGQKREVECMSCHKKIQFKDAIILTNKKVVKYLCKECNHKIEKGGLNTQEKDWKKIIDEIDKVKATRPYIPKDDTIGISPNTFPRTIPDGIWEPYSPGSTYTIGNKTYDVYTSKNEALLKLEPNHANKTSK